MGPGGTSSLRKIQLRWWSRSGSNRRPTACKAAALPTELRPQNLPRRPGNRAKNEDSFLKTRPSSDCSLQLDYMKSESLVMAHQLRRREYVPRPCTHRPSHHESRLYPKSLSQPAREAGAEGMAGNWDEVVTR